MININLSKIPGFRTGKWWKKSVAVVGYLFYIVLIQALPPGVKASDYLVNIIQVTIVAGIPYILITNVGNIKDKLPLLNRKKPTSTVLGIILICICAGISILILDNFISPEYKDIIKKEAERRGL